MKTLIRKNSIKFTGSVNESSYLSKIALKLIDLIGGDSKQKYSLQKGFLLSEVEITFSDYFSSDIKEWILIAKIK